MRINIKKIFIIVTIAIIGCLPIKAQDNIVVNSTQIPPEVIRYVCEFFDTTTLPSDVKIYYVKDWNNYKVYKYIEKRTNSEDGIIPVIGLPMHILHNDKLTRFATGCERDEIMSNGKFSCKQSISPKMKIYYHDK